MPKADPTDDIKWTKHTRISRVLELLETGKSIAETARLTGEHRRQVQRWSKKKKCRPFADVRKTISSPPSTCYGSYGGETFQAFDRDGESITAYNPHPMDEIEPEYEPDQSKSNLIAAAALRYLMRMEPRSMEKVAQEIGCTKAAISRVLVEMSDRIGVRALNQKSQNARASYREARNEVVAKKRTAK